MRQVDRFNDFVTLLGCKIPSEPPTKEVITNTIIHYMFNRTQSIFEWRDLPDTIPAYMLELYLQMNGHCAFMQHNDALYIYTGGLGGKPDVYYRPTIYTIANPAQEISVNAKIGIDCVVMKNDTTYTGLYPLNMRYASNMADVEQSLYLANINSRIISLISAQDDRTRKSAEKYISDIAEGRLGIIAEQKFLEDLKTTQYANAGAHAVITDLIELMQYNKASWYNEIGLNANYNMKRESINSGESQLNNDALAPLVDNMLTCRRDAIKLVNEMFGTSISVEFASSWRDNEIEIENELGRGDHENAVSEVEVENVDGSNPDSV